MATVKGEWVEDRAFQMTIRALEGSHEDERMAAMRALAGMKAGNTLGVVARHARHSDERLYAMECAKSIRD
jgi:hypothetical protein